MVSPDSLEGMFDLYELKIQTVQVTEVIHTRHGSIGRNRVATGSYPRMQKKGSMLGPARKAEQSSSDSFECSHDGQFINTRAFNPAQKPGIRRLRSTIGYFTVRSRASKYGGAVRMGVGRRRLRGGKVCVWESIALRETIVEEGGCYPR